MSVVRVRPKFPEKVAPLFTPAPIKVIHGGRGKGASWSFARALLLLGAKRKLFVVCAREIQKSIKDSVHKLLSDQIVNLKFNAHRSDDGEDVPAFYEVLDTEIRGINGTTIVFVGLNNIESIKSMEGIDILWVTEAVHVPKSKWIVLLPTVRRDPPFGPFKQGSEIWIDLNPELTSDDTYQMFVVNPPPGTVVIEMSWRDNEWFPKILYDQMIHMRNTDRDEWLTVWEGKTRKALQGAIFAKEIEAGVLDGRIGPNIKYDKSRPVTASFDLGDSDMTAMWVWQQVGNEHIAIDYEEDCGKDIVHFLQILAAKKYLMKRIILPHDARQAHQSARRLVHNTIEKQVKAVYTQPGVVKVMPTTDIPIRLNAARSLFPRVCINDVTCSRGLLALQHYQYSVDADTRQRSKKPLHNWASHGGSAFCEYAVALHEGYDHERRADTGGLPDIERDGRPSSLGHSSVSWMG